MLRTLLLLSFFLGAPVFAEGGGPSAEAPEVPVLIVDRRPQSISLFVSMPARDLSALFGTGGEDLLGVDGTIDVDGLYEGTFRLADRIFAPVEARIGGERAVFEGLSMMVHDPAVLPEFRTPWDGETAIAVCTSPETVDNMGLERLQAYLGFFVWKTDGMAPLSLRFPDTGREALTVEVRDFWNMQPLGVERLELEDGGTLVLEAGKAGSALPLGAILMALACLGVGVVFIGLHMQERRRATATAD
jgi:hypothetical protein